MIKSYMVSAFRNIAKNKIYSALNVFGLALGIAACFFIFQYVHFESGYDRFYTHAKDTYRVTLTNAGGLSGSDATNHQESVRRFDMVYFSYPARCAFIDHPGNDMCAVCEGRPCKSDCGIAHGINRNSLI